MELAEWNGRKIFVMLKGNRVYSGIVKDVTCSNPKEAYFTIYGNYGEIVTFKFDEVKVMQEES